MKQRISTSFSKYTDAGLEDKAKLIISSMSGNPDFPVPYPSIEDVQAASGAYSAARLAAANLGRTFVADKNAARITLDDLLSQLGNYVMNIADGDLAMLTGSGYTLYKQRELRYITNPGNVTISNGLSSGELKASVKAVAGATGYLYEITGTSPDENAVWTSIPSAACRYTFTNLQPGKQYWVRVAATGSRQQLTYSPVATQFAQ